MVKGINKKYHRSDASFGQLGLSGVASWPEGPLGVSVRICAAAYSEHQTSTVIPVIWFWIPVVFFFKDE